MLEQDAKSQVVKKHSHHATARGNGHGGPSDQTITRPFDQLNGTSGLFALWRGRTSPYFKRMRN